MTIKLGGYGKVFVNQANRSYDVIAVIGDRALIEYAMPNGREYLVEIGTDIDLPAREYRGPWINRTWAKLPKAWAAAVEQGVEDLKAARVAAIAALEERNRLDRQWAAYTGFRNRRDCLEAGGAYRPSMNVRDPIMRELADDYDAGQAAAGDDRRAYRYGA